MQTEIKFRAWYPSTKKMRHFSNGEIIADGEFRYGMFFPCEEGSVYLCNCEVMQYAGLKDKNGKEIYEGDICSDNYSDVYEILWSDLHQWACKLVKTNYVLSRGLTFPLWHYDNCKENGYRQLEVIGNIYENPELLECKDNVK